MTDKDNQESSPIGKALLGDGKVSPGDEKTSRLRALLAQPGSREALLTLGQRLTQPLKRGESSLGNVTSGLLEAVTAKTAVGSRIEGEEIKQREIAVKETTAAAKTKTADAAVLRAGQGGAKAQSRQQIAAAIKSIQPELTDEQALLRAAEFEKISVGKSREQFKADALAKFAIDNAFPGVTPEQQAAFEKLIDELAQMLPSSSMFSPRSIAPPEAQAQFQLEAAQAKMPPGTRLGAFGTYEDRTGYVVLDVTGQPVTPGMVWVPTPTAPAVVPPAPIADPNSITAPLVMPTIQPSDIPANVAPPTTIPFN